MLILTKQFSVTARYAAGVGTEEIFTNRKDLKIW
jgi:hypothetical protein